MHFVLWTHIIIQIYLCSSTVLEDPADNLDEILEKPGWNEIIKYIKNSNAKSLLGPNPSKKSQRHFNGDKDHNAAHILSNLYATVFQELNSFYFNMSHKYRYLPAKDRQLNHFRNLVESINIFEPLRQCMLNALQYFKKKYSVLNVLDDYQSFCKNINNILKHEMYENNDNNELNQNDENNLKVHLTNNKNIDFVNSYLFNILGKKELINLSELKEYVTTYIKTLQDLSNSNEKYVLNINYPEFGDIVKNGVHMFCINFGFD